MFNIKNFKYLILLSIIVSGVYTVQSTERIDIKKELEHIDNNDNINPVSRNIKKVDILINSFLAANNINQFISEYNGIRSFADSLQFDKSLIATDVTKIKKYIIEKINYERSKVIPFLKDVMHKLSECDSQMDFQIYQQPLAAIQLSKYIDNLQTNVIKEFDDFKKYDFYSKLLNQVMDCIVYNDLNTELDYIFYYIKEGDALAEKYLENYGKGLLTKLKKDLQLKHEEFYQILARMKQYKTFRRLYNKLGNAYIEIFSNENNSEIDVNELVDGYQNNEETREHLEHFNSIIDNAYNPYVEDKSTPIVKQLKEKFKSAQRLAIGILRNLQDNFHDDNKTYYKKIEDYNKAYGDGYHDEETTDLVNKCTELVNLFSQVNIIINNDVSSEDQKKEYLKNTGLQQVFNIYMLRNKAAYHHFIEETNPNDANEKYKNEDFITHITNNLPNFEGKEEVTKINNLLNNKNAVSDINIASKLFKELANLNNNQISEE